MKRVEQDEFEDVRLFFDMAATSARNATCHRAKCGAVIVKDDEIIGGGFNSPALDDEDQRMCNAEMDTTVKPKYDKTCCIHAEWRAILDACKDRPDKIAGSVLYFMRVDADGKWTDAGLPFCTVCSRLAMESGISEFALYNDGGADIYPTSEYNKSSYAAYIKT